MGRTAALSLNSGRGDWTLSQARLRGSGRPKQLEEGTGWGGVEILLGWGPSWAGKWA